MTGLEPPFSAERYQELRNHYLKVGAQVDVLLDKHGIDILIAPGDCFFTQYATATGTRPITF